MGEGKFKVFISICFTVVMIAVALYLGATIGEKVYNHFAEQDRIRHQQEMAIISQKIDEIDKSLKELTTRMEEINNANNRAVNQ